MFIQLYKIVLKHYHINLYSFIDILALALNSIHQETSSNIAEYIFDFVF